MTQSSSTTSQQSSSQPWQNAMPEVNGLLGQLSSLIPGSGLTAAESGAINQLTQNAQAGNPYASAVGNVATNLLNGGGATSEVPALQQNLQNYQSQLQKEAAPGYSTLDSPAVQAALQQVATDTNNTVSSQFAAAGRSGSGMNQQTLARGIAQAEAPIILNQANQDTQTQMNAAGALYGAGNTTASGIAGMNQQGIANQEAGIDASNSALQAQNWGPQQTIAAQELAKSLPASTLGLLAQIGIPLAQLGTNSNGTSTTNTNPSFFSLLGSGPSSGGSGGSGLLGLLGLISDRRMKEDIEQVGALFDGTPVYRFRYIGHPVFHIGLMAQDIEDDRPEAVIEIDGVKRVDYRAATERAVAARGC
jgi:hypothetical protein